MPLMVGMRGWKTNVKLEGIDKRWRPGLLKRLFGARHVVVETIEGHAFMVRLSDIVCIEHTPQSEVDRQAAAEQRAKELAASASHCRKCGTDSPRENDFCPRCGSALVKKEQPKHIVPAG
jgi:hypothetical protein